MEKRPIKKRHYLMNVLDIFFIIFKEIFRNLTRLTILKVRGIYLQIQYKAAEISYIRELKKATKEKTNWRTTLLKYLYIGMAGIAIFLILQPFLERSRGYRAIGGEFIFLLLPIVWPLVQVSKKETVNNET